MRCSPLVYEIQTTNRCNGKCVICPHASISQSYQSMDMMLYKKVIDDIAAQKRDVRIALYLNGEPFLDELFQERLEYARRKCHGAIIEVSTNLSVLDDRILEAIEKFDIDDFRISSFGFSQKTYETVMPGLKFAVFQRNLEKVIRFRKKTNKLRNCSLTMIDIPELSEAELMRAADFCSQHGLLLNYWGYLDRAGNVPLRKNHVFESELNEEQKEYTCAQQRHMERMHILVDGTVVLCCQDWRAEYIMGSIKTQSIRAIWEGEEYERMRSAIDENGYPYPAICKKCKILLEGKK